MGVAHGLLGPEVAWELLSREAVIAREEAIAVLHAQGQVAELAGISEEVSAHAHGGELLHATLLAPLVLEPHLCQVDRRDKLLNEVFLTADNCCEYITD